MTHSQISRNRLLRNDWQFEAIGTKWVIETADPLEESIRSNITKTIEEFDHVYSRFRSDSVVMRMSKNAGQFELSKESSAMAAFYHQLYTATDGAMTPLIGDSLDAAGYDKEYSFNPTTPLPAPVWDEVMEWSDTTATTTQPLILDIGAAGKGKLVDMVAAYMYMAGITSFIIDASGDICHRGIDIQTIGLEDPNDPTHVIGVMPLSGASLCASAVNRRRWGDGWHHVIDGRTGKPVTDVIATWVVAASTMEADGLATALFFVGGDKLQSLADFQFVRLLASGQIEYSRDFVGQLYT